MDRELIRIGTGEARITQVLPERIEYLDESGTAQSVVLEECLLKGYVGQRNLIASLPYVSLNDAQKTSFLFESYEAAYELLLAPLRLAGWKTMDVT